MQDIMVVLYGHAGCPGTQRARQFFKDHQISIIDKDIADPMVQTEWLAFGSWATPLVIIGGVKMIGFDAQTCEQLLQDARRRHRHG